MIQATEGKLHWNYFLALEKDMEIVARYVEFTKANFSVYSIELAHLLFAAASEVDVICKLLCKLKAPDKKRHNIDDYREILAKEIPDMITEFVLVSRYGLTLKPWENWATGTNPDWWRSYNNVKHERDVHFSEATLQNALNALAGLLVVTFYYYKHTLKTGDQAHFIPKDVMRQLQPQSVLFDLRSDYYPFGFIGY